MFKSKQRPIAIPGWEHQKLAGTLALLWGNADFERPPVAFESFLAGVGLHDRAYGPLDNLPIGELAEEQWLALTRGGFEMAWSDPIADLIAKMHLQRLVSYRDAPARQAPGRRDGAGDPGADPARRLGCRCLRADRSDHQSVRPDRVRCLLRGASRRRRAHLSHNDRDEEIVVRYRIEDSTIQVAPWPFAVDRHQGYLVGYQLDGYPAVLEPVVLTYQLARAARR